MSIRKTGIGLIFVLLFCASWRNARAQQYQSLYNDIRAHKVGDVITVILTENISGSSSTKASNSSNTGGSAKSSISGSLVPFKPEFGADAHVKYNSNEKMSADQKQLLSGTLSVRIVKISKDGEFVIAGKRNTEINGERHELTLKGFIRPSDISQSNQVLSYRIADAQITYLKKKGKEKIKNKTGFGHKILWGALVLITAAAAFMAGGN